MNNDLQMECYLAWWWKFYMAGLLTFCMFTGCTPDQQKIERVVMRAVRWRIKLK